MAGDVQLGNHRAAQGRSAPARAGEISLLDACAGHLIGLLGPRRGEFLAALEVKLAVARRATMRSAGEQADAAFVDLITTFTRDRARAHAIYVTILGFAVASVLTSPAPTEPEIREFTRGILAGYNLPGPEGTKRA